MAAFPKHIKLELILILVSFCFSFLFSPVCSLHAVKTQLIRLIHNTDTSYRSRKRVDSLDRLNVLYGTYQSICMTKASWIDRMYNVSHTRDFPLCIHLLWVPAPQSSFDNTNLRKAFTENCCHVKWQVQREFSYGAFGYKTWTSILLLCINRTEGHREHFGEKFIPVAIPAASPTIVNIPLSDF